MLVFNRSLYSFYLKNHEYQITPGDSLEIDDDLWESDDQLARNIESLDKFAYVMTSDQPVGYPRTVEFPEVMNIIGGSQPVSCMIANLSFLVDDVGTYDIKWDHLWDNIWDENILSEIPDGLGLSFSFDGTDATITTTEAGTWAFSFDVHIGVDDNWKGYFHTSMSPDVPILGPRVVDGFMATFAAVWTLPEGAFFAPQIVATAAANTPGLAANAELVIVRLA